MNGVKAAILSDYWRLRERAFTEKHDHLGPTTPLTQRSLVNTPHEDGGHTRRDDGLVRAGFALAPAASRQWGNVSVIVHDGSMRVS